MGRAARQTPVAACLGPEVVGPQDQLALGVYAGPVLEQELQGTQVSVGEWLGCLAGCFVFFGQRAVEVLWLCERAE